MHLVLDGIDTAVRAPVDSRGGERVRWSGAVHWQVCMGVAVVAVTEVPAGRQRQHGGKDGADRSTGRGVED